MTLTIHNTLSGKKEIFKPIDANNVRMYVCGMTVYDFCHIGHARVLVVFDMVYRHLCSVYGRDHVTYIRNITDIDDKIINRAEQENMDFREFAQKYIDEMNQDSDALGVLRPQQEPRATEFMEPILNMIGQLEKNGLAYQADNGDVFYPIDDFANYGALSGKKADQLRAGERVAVDQHKRNPHDFVLWKSAKPGEPSWASPWGNGRPGWHIECAAMSTQCLGNHFDIHGGGLDLQFPHHENEIAESEGATGEKFVNVWMHNGFVRVDDEKMSKSLGNFFTIREVLQKYHPEVIRFFILSSHYRSPLNYSDQHLDGAQAALTTLYTALKGLDVDGINAEIEPQALQRFNVAMNDDFNSPEAISVLFELAKQVNRLRQQGDSAPAPALSLKRLGERLGLLQLKPEQFLQGGDSDIDEAYIQEQIALRLQARKDRDWAKSDAIRDDLLNKGIVLEDGPNGTDWRRAP